MKKMSPVLKGVYIALKVGFVAAKLAGVPVPDVSQLIPSDLLEFQGSILNAIGAAGKAAVSDEDLAVVEAVKTGQVGGARLRPAMLQGDQLALVKSYFGAVQVWLSNS